MNGGAGVDFSIKDINAHAWKSLLNVKRSAEVICLVASHVTVKVSGTAWDRARNLVPTLFPLPPLGERAWARHQTWLRRDRQILLFKDSTMQR